MKWACTDKVQFIELDPQGFDRYIFGDYEFQLCKGKERFKERLLKAFPKQEPGINKFLEVSDKISKAMDSALSMGDGLSAMLGFLLKHPMMLKYSRVPYQKLLDEVTSDKRLQAVLSGPWGTYGLPPSRSSVIVPILVLNHYLAGAYYPQGGSGEYESFKATIGKSVVKEAERYIPSLSKHIKYVEYASPLSNEYWVNAVRGGCYGPEQTPDQTGPGRFSSLTAGIKGLFLVGAGTLGGGIMPCVASGVLAGEKAAKLLTSRF